MPQSDFLPNHFSKSAQVTGCYTNGPVSDLILLDLLAAFDKADHLNLGTLSSLDFQDTTFS